MRKLIVISVIINFLLITLTTKLVGLFLAFLLFLGTYYFLVNKFPHKPGLAEKSAFASVHFAAIIAVHLAYRNPEYTAVTIVFETVFLIVLLAVASI